MTTAQYDQSSVAAASNYHINPIEFPCSDKCPGFFSEILN